MLQKSKIIRKKINLLLKKIVLLVAYNQCYLLKSLQNSFRRRVKSDNADIYIKYIKFCFKKIINIYFLLISNFRVKCLVRYISILFHQKFILSST